ncbi:NAD(P)/FAD-dependent oxidoreductase [Erwinia mallotivora]|uniref:NAD(P)/FAD-dependent oxidoreductase n=1 Tax=Erwinia mallotivora TaxID=69222 RepID=UPI0021BFF9FB|nr:FAD-binding oxidoreductase [Erwinia mallotivora]
MKYASIPFNQNRNGWLDGHPLSVPHPPLNGDITADWVVIGSGFAGLAFARRLAQHDPQLRIVILDSACAAESSSARNSGFIIGLPHNIGSSTAELKKAQDYRTLLQEGIRLIDEMVKQHRIDCDWETVGKYHCQVDARNNQILQEYRDSLDALGESYTLFDQQMLAQKLGTHFYAKGIYTPGAVLVNPATLAVGLASSLPGNVMIYDHTPALEIHYGSTNRVFTPGGSITARKVMLATNALSSALAPRHSRQAAMATFASITAPLTAEQQQRLPDTGSWGLTPVNAIAGATLRYTRDGRFMIRQHVVPALKGAVTAAQTYQATQLHRQIFHKIYPQLSDVSLTECWSGTISVTRNGAPVWGTLGNNVYTASGCNGAGISKQTVAGALLADYVLGYDNPLIASMLALGQANYLPPSPILDVAIAISLAKERYMGRNEM